MAKEFRFEELIKRLQAAERELEAELQAYLAEQRDKFHYTLENGRVKFESEFKAFQQRYRVGAWRYLKEAKLSYILTAPIIYGMIIPLALLDLSLTLYQHLCFRVYGIPLVKRADYFAIDRHLLSYLNAIEKLNCVYCGYGNGVIAYGREITARTEQFWCPIKHARKAAGAHDRADKFLEYGDANAWRERLNQIRRDWGDTE